MIYTLTANPSLDYVVHTDIVPNSLNRSKAENIYPGGKGINVSIMLANLGCKSIALGAVAGETGRMLENMMRPYAETDFIHLSEGMTRINLKALGKNGETEINGRGVNAAAGLYKEKLENIGPDDYLVISGSFGDYKMISELLPYTETKKIIFDIPKLEYAVKESPFFIKPNLFELEEYFNCTITISDLEKYCRRLLDQGCKNVLVSLGSEGAFFCNKNFVFRKKAIEGRVVNTVCSGDSMVAGVLYGMVNNFPVDQSISLGIACGSATAFCEHIASKEDVMKFFERS